MCDQILAQANDTFVSAGLHGSLATRHSGDQHSSGNAMASKELANNGRKGIV